MDTPWTPAREGGRKEGRRGNEEIRRPLYLFCPPKSRARGQGAVAGGIRCLCSGRRVARGSLWPRDFSPSLLSLSSLLLHFSHLLPFVISLAFSPHPRPLSYCVSFFPSLVCSGFSLPECRHILRTEQWLSLTTYKPHLCSRDYKTKRHFRVPFSGSKRQSLLVLSRSICFDSRFLNRSDSGCSVTGKCQENYHHCKRKGNQRYALSRTLSLVERDFGLFHFLDYQFLYKVNVTL